MITIRIGFPAGGRWHATAWGTHVNEGIPEWPPSPWRLCRALLAVWHWKHRQDKPVLDSLLYKLVDQLPAYHLPEASLAHTRHYMPVNEGKNEKRTKIFDTFVQISSGNHLYIQWEIELTTEERNLLSFLLESMSYMGRAESLVEACLVDSAPVSPQKSWTLPLESGLSESPKGEIIRLLAPLKSADYQQWIQKQQTKVEVSKGKKKKKDTLQETILEALSTDTADWKKEGWDIPPGSKWVQYVRPEDCFRVAPISIPNKKTSLLPTVARFAITTKVPPAITQSLSLAERFHQSLCAQLNGENNPTLTGLDDTGKPLKDNDHTYFLPECDSHGYVTHMTLYAPRGFSDSDSQILARLRKVWNNVGKEFDLQIVLLATGQPADFNPASPYFRKSRIWESITPFVPVRHAKTTHSGTPKIDPENGLQIGSPEHDCQRLINLSFPDTQIVKINKIDEKGARIQCGLRSIPCLKFQLQRRKGNGTKAGNRGYALRIEFEQPVTLPYGFGYGAHFGLGLFTPVS